MARFLASCVWEYEDNISTGEICGDMCVHGRLCGEKEDKRRKKSEGRSQIKRMRSIPFKGIMPMYAHSEVVPTPTPQCPGMINHSF